MVRHSPTKRAILTELIANIFGLMVPISEILAPEATFVTVKSVMILRWLIFILKTREFM